MTKWSRSTHAFTRFRAVLATALPCSDRCDVDWRGPQTQRREFGISPLQWVYRNSKVFRDFADREQPDRVVLYVCGRHRRSVSAPALPTWLFCVILPSGCPRLKRDKICGTSNRSRRVEPFIAPCSRECLWSPRRKHSPGVFRISACSRTSRECRGHPA